jgi:Transcriptional regulatory protein, C terminal
VLSRECGAPLHYHCTRAVMTLLPQVRPLTLDLSAGGRARRMCGICGGSAAGSGLLPWHRLAVGGWRAWWPGLPRVVSRRFTAGYDPVMGAGARGGPAGAVGGGLVVGLLGPVEVAAAGGGLAGVARPMLRVLVALLAVAPGRVVPDEALVDGLWGEEWSREREQKLHTHVSALRRLVAAAEPGRYRPGRHRPAGRCCRPREPGPWGRWRSALSWTSPSRRPAVFGSSAAPGKLIARTASRR